MMENLERQWTELYKDYVKGGKKDKKIWKNLQELDKKMNNEKTEVVLDKGCTT